MTDWITPAEFFRFFAGAACIAVILFICYMTVTAGGTYGRGRWE